MEYKVMTEEQLKEDENFEELCIHSNLLQTELWGKFKEDSWSPETVGLYEDGMLVGYFLSLTRPLPLGIKMVYIARGPILNEWTEFKVESLYKVLARYGKYKKAIEVKIDPYVLHSVGLVKEDVESLNEELVDAMVKEGFEHKGYTEGLDATIQPRYQAVVMEDNFKVIPKKLKQYVNIATRRGVQIEKFEGAEAVSKVDVFYSILHKTEERKNIHLRNEDYFKKIFTLFTDASMYLGKIDLNELNTKNLEEVINLSNDYTKLEEDKAKLNTKTYTKRLNKLNETEVSLKKEREALDEAIAINGKTTVYISCALTIRSGNTSELLYAGMDDLYKYFSPAYKTWYEAVADSFKYETITRVNLGGISGKEVDGLITFKRNFNPTIEEYIGEFDVVVDKKMSKLFAKALQVRKKIMHRG